MRLRIERDEQVLYDGRVEAIEFAEKDDGTVSVVGRPEQPERPAGAGIVEALKAMGERAAERKREDTLAHARMLRETEGLPIQQTTEIEA